ncbi:hypothetical protein [Candidatus Vidania fulgoroideorum]
MNKYTLNHLYHYFLRKIKKINTINIIFKHKDKNFYFNSYVNFYKEINRKILFSSLFVKIKNVDFYNETNFKEINKKKYNFLVTNNLGLSFLKKKSKFINRKIIPDINSGLVSDNLNQLNNVVKGKIVNLKTDKYGIIHSFFAKTNFKLEYMKKNLESLKNLFKINNIFFEKVFISTTFSKSFLLDF